MGKPVVNLKGSIALSMAPPAPMARGNTPGSSYGNRLDDRKELLQSWRRKDWPKEDASDSPAARGDATSSGGATAGKRNVPEDKYPRFHFGTASEEVTSRPYRFGGETRESPRERRVKIARSATASDIPALAVGETGANSRTTDASWASGS